MKLRIGDKEYQWGGTSGVPLIHLIRVQRELGIGQNELAVMQQEQDAIRQKYMADVKIAEKEGREPPAEPELDVFLLGITVWLTRLSAGEKLSFEEACDFNVQEMRFEPEPGDLKESEEADPTTPAAKPKGTSAKSKRPVEAVA